MKKVFLFGLMLFGIVFSCFAVNNMGIQMIGGPGVDTTPVSLDNMKVGESVTIDGYARITITDATTVDYIDSYKKGETILGFSSSDKAYRDRMTSGNEADYYILKMDIVNLALTPTNFLNNCTVKATFNEVYQFQGWAHQFNWNNRYYTHDGDQLNRKAYINDADQFEIGPMYAGHYVFGITLPNAVIEGKEPLSIVITIGGNELTYTVRK